MISERKTCWSSPSNIAIIKYWGKYGNQLPMNPSLSFTLDFCRTTTTIDWSPVGLENGGFEFYYDGKRKPEFETKLNAFFIKIKKEYPLFGEIQLKINSVNNFPHSAGIASSASAMSALSCCLTDIYCELKSNFKIGSIDFWRMASILSRLGSGSACRSVYPEAASWGKFDSVKGSDDHFASPCQQFLDPLFQHLNDWILIVNESEKSVSSSLGHQLMENHHYRQGRIAQAHQNINHLILALQSGDWEKFAEISEEEALSLHGLMMSSQPGYILLEPQSLQLIRIIREARKALGIPVCFTIDAGPNIHMLFPDRAFSQVSQWATEHLMGLLSPESIIKDNSGTGPLKIS